jgi:pyroglutamyl-peptidase
MSHPVEERLPLLVTGFEPFDGRRRNRSWDAVSGLAGRPGVKVQQLPVHFARLRQEVPRLVSGQGGLLLVGESPVAHLCVEQVALNVVDSARPDNAGATARMEALVADGPLALRAAWDAGSVAGRLARDGIPAAASFHAGTYACNAALYLALHAAASRVPVGFLHVPHRGWPFGMRTVVLRRAIVLCLDALAVEAGAMGLELETTRADAGRRA